MSITLKVILLMLGILAFIGCIFWWNKEDGWEPKIATIGALSTILVLIFNISQNNERHDEGILIKKNNNSPIASKIETQNNYYIQDSSKEKESNDKIQVQKKIETEIKPMDVVQSNSAIKKYTYKGDSAAEIRKKIIDTEDLFRDKIAKSFDGYEIDWICNIFEIRKIDDQFVKIICNQPAPGYNSSPGIHFKLRLEKYPILYRIKGKDKKEIRVKGIIEKVSSNSPVLINPTEVLFENVY